MKAQWQIILDHLKKRPLTSAAAWDNYGISKLATRVSELIYQGHPIQKRKIRVQNRYGDFVNVTQYRI